jgi:hypothetical protein
MSLEKLNAPQIFTPGGANFVAQAGNEITWYLIATMCVFELLVLVAWRGIRKFRLLSPRAPKTERQLFGT